MQDFPANSQKAKAQTPPEPRARIQQVTSAETVRRKRTLGHKMKETFIGGDARTAVDHVFFTVLIPSVRDMLYDAFDSGMRSLIFGEQGNKHRRGPVSGYPLGRAEYTPYNKMGSSPVSRPAEQQISRRARSRHSFDELVIASRQEAEEVIDQMYEIMSRYGTVSIADLYELTGVRSSHTDMKWGWAELPGAKAVRLRQGGFVLDLPKPQSLG